MNTRFAVATHVLAFLAYQGGRLVTSDQVASSVGTHPALVRRILSTLRTAGLIETQLGPGGGARLARPPREITLLDVYRTTEFRHDLFAIDRICPNRDCPMGARIQATLECVLAAPQAALYAALGRVTLADVYAQAAGTMPACAREPAA